MILVVIKLNKVIFKQLISKDILMIMIRLKRIKLNMLMNMQLIYKIKMIKCS